MRLLIHVVLILSATAIAAYGETRNKSEHAVDVFFSHCVATMKLSNSQRAIQWHANGMRQLDTARVAGAIHKKIDTAWDLSDEIGEYYLLLQPTEHCAILFNNVEEESIVKHFKDVMLKTTVAPLQISVHDKLAVPTDAVKINQYAFTLQMPGETEGLFVGLSIDSDPSSSHDANLDISPIINP